LIFSETGLADAYIIDVEPITDERGFFARSWCRKEFEKYGLNNELMQCNISFNKKKGTLRGMHYQNAPYEETKLVRCTSGSIFDVIIDLRSDSDTFRDWIGVKLSAENHRMLYIPEGFAHGFQTLEDNTEVFYQMSSEYVAQAESGVRWDDPAFNVRWPLISNISLSEKDRDYDFLQE